MSANTVPTYRALSGVELKALILKRIEAELDATGRFGQHVTYPNCQFAFVVNVRLPTMTDRNFTVERVVEDELLPEDVPAETVAVQGGIEESADNPADKIREDAGMPVTVQSIGKGHAGMPVIVEQEITRAKQDGKRGGKR